MSGKILTEYFIQVYTKCFIFCTVCPIGQSPCINNRTQCLENDLFCNGVADCPDQSDEIACCESNYDVLCMEPEYYGPSCGSRYSILGVEKN